MTRKIPSPKINSAMSFYIKVNGIKLTAIRENGRIKGYRAYNPLEAISFYYIPVYSHYKRVIKNFKRELRLRSINQGKVNTKFFSNQDCLDVIEDMKLRIKTGRSKWIVD